MLQSDSQRILLLAHNVEGIGTYIRFAHLAEQLASLGHSVTLVAGKGSRTGKTNTTSAGNLTKILVPEIFGRRISNGGLGPWETLYRIRFVLHNRFDIVHASEHRPSASLPALISQRFRSARFISDWADWWGRGGIVEDRKRLTRTILRGPETFFESVIHQSADAVTAISRALQNRALGLGVPEEHLLLLSNGADTERIRPFPRDEARRRLGLPGDGKILVYAGMAPIDMDLIWDSYLHVAAGYPGRVYLLILGKEWRLPAKLNFLRPRIFQPGMVDRGIYPEYLSAGDLMLLPIRNRLINQARWPGKLGDYLAAGRPIISNPTGEVRRILEDDPVGILADETPEAFGQAVLMLLSDPAACQRMGARAREVAEEKFSWEKIVRPLPAFYRRISSPASTGDKC